MPPPPIKLVSGTDLARRQVPREVAAPREALGNAPKKRLGELLIARGIVTKEALDQALEEQTRWDARLGEILCSDHGVRSEDLDRAMAAQQGIPLVSPADEPHDPTLAAAYGAEQCLADQCLPWRRIGARTVILVDAPAQFEKLRSKLTETFGPVIVGLTSRNDLQEALARLHRRDLQRRAEQRVPETVSCRDWRGQLFSRVVAALIATLVVGALLINDVILLAVSAWAIFTLFAVTALKLVAVLAGMRRETPQAAKILHFSKEPAQTKLPVVSLLVPLLNEDEIAQGLVRALSELRYPRSLLDICLAVESDDLRTHVALENADLPPEFRVIRVPAGELRTKPRALNYALDFARGSIVGVYDAEDAPDPDQIKRVVAHFQTADPWVACVQGALDFYNRRQSWLTRCFTLDYAIWFRSVLPGLARLKMPLPLGGTTLFFRRTALEELGAWDAHNVTEDADLGLRLARAGFRTELLDTVTREQATSRVVPWIRQRSRWLKGYAMTYGVHMRNPIRLWRDLGTRGFLAVQIMFLGTISQFTLAPVLWSWWLVAFGLPHPVATALPSGWATGVILSFLSCEAVSLGVGLISARRARCVALAPWLVTMTLYHMLATLASYKALIELVAKPFYWDKTHHPCPSEAHGPAPA